MGKSTSSETKVKRGPDLTLQKVRKARRCLQSAGRRGLEAFLGHNPDVKSNKVVVSLTKRAEALPVRPPKGKRGPKQPSQRSSPEEQPVSA